MRGALGGSGTGGSGTGGTRWRAGSSLAAAVLLAVGVWVLAPRPASGWGQTGHRVVGELAERHLSPPARRAVRELLDGHSLARASTWPDEIRAFPRWSCTSPYHYVTIPPGESYPGQGLPEGDAIDALTFFVDLLREPATPREQRQTALRFVVHLLGDLHQPLHTGLGCDRGGNDISADYFGETRKLHSVWDSGMVDSEKLSFTEFVEFLDLASPQRIRELQASSPLDWAEEAQALLPQVYTCYVKGDRCPCFCGDGCRDGTSVFGGCRAAECEWIAAGPVVLGYQYQAHNLPVVHDQLLKGGIRLAGLLEWVFTNRQAPAAWEELASAMRELAESDRAAMASCVATGTH